MRKYEQNSPIATGFRFRVKTAIAAVLLTTMSALAVGQSVTKSGTDLTTQSTTATSAGRTVRYAVSLGLPNDQTATSLKVTDAIPAGMSYVPGSLKLPSNAAGGWSIDGGASYVTSEPSGTVTHLRVTGDAYMAATSTISPLPVAPAASASGGTGGDGYRAIPYNGKVYSIYHHNANSSLYCGNQASGTACPGFPTVVPATAGQAFAPGSSWYETPLVVDEYLDRTSGRLYFYARDNVTQKPVVVCADLTTGKSCGSYVFSGVPVISPSSSYFTVTGAHFGTRFYANGAGGNLLCFDTATFAPCSGTNSDGTFTVAGAPSGTDYHADNGILSIGSRLYWQAVDYAANQTSLVCFDMATNAACAGFTIQTMAMGGNFMPTATAAGVSDGFCLARGGATSCYDLNGNDVTAGKSTFAAYVHSHPLPYGGSWLTLGAAVLANGPAVSNSRTLWQDGSAKVCWDWTTNAECTGYDTSLGVNDLFYETVVDPANPTCVWALGDEGMLTATSSLDGGFCTSAVKTQVVATPSANYCDGRAHPMAWSRIQVFGVPSTAYGSAKVTIRDSAGIVVGDWNAKTTTLPVDISSIPVAGSTTTLAVEVELLGITDPKPFDATPSPYVSVSWTGDPQQVCFDAKLVCGTTIASPLVNTVSGIIAGVNVSASHTFTDVSQSCAVAVLPAPDSGNAQAGTAATPVANVAANDLVSGLPATLGAAGNATVAPSGAWPAGITLDTSTGAVSTTAAVAPGTYTMNYTLCDKSVPANCLDTTVTITVTPAVKPDYPVQPVPALGTFGLVGLSGLIAGVAMRRRRRTGA